MNIPRIGTFYIDRERNLTLGTSNFRHFRHSKQGTFQDEYKQATTSGGGNLTRVIFYLLPEYNFQTCCGSIIDTTAYSSYTPSCQRRL
jgi:hypothetical protein